MNPSMRLQREDSVLVVIDVQEGLLRAMDQEIGKKMIRNVQILIRFATEMGIPVLATEQYPKGLGETVPEIKKTWGAVVPLEKTTFSCCALEPFDQHLNSSKRRQVILTGTETHVCVLQTAADLVEGGYEVHVAADAVCSRRKLDWERGLRWMEKKGATISTTEIVAFQLLRRAGTEEFRKLSKLVR
jgi:nicotinamidase-related amidase